MKRFIEGVDRNQAALFAGQPMGFERPAWRRAISKKRHHLRHWCFAPQNLRFPPLFYPPLNFGAETGALGTIWCFLVLYRQRHLAHRAAGELRSHRGWPAPSSIPDTDHAACHVESQCSSTAPFPKQSMLGQPGCPGSKTNRAWQLWSCAQRFSRSSNYETYSVSVTR